VNPDRALLDAVGARPSSSGPSRNELLGLSRHPGIRSKPARTPQGACINESVEALLVDMDGNQPVGMVEPVSTASECGALREALGAFATGVTVVTSSGAGGLCGVTANAFTSVSLAPPLVLVCLRSTSATARMIARNRVFAVNVLGVDQETLARRFSSRARPRGHNSFSGVPHRSEATAAPILVGVPCWFDCAMVAMSVAGDHVVVIGRIVAFDRDRDREPLLFHLGRYRIARDIAASASLPPTRSPLLT
jgi:flavin reductase (DIM6/NTAB) family NADH-FMN oxidoreductase RutF